MPPAPAYPPPPPVGAYPVPAGYPPPGYAYPPPPRTSTSAIVGLVLAITSWVVCPIIPAVVALVLAHQSDREIETSNGTIGGDGLNTATRIISWINIGVWGALAVGFGIMFLFFGLLTAVNPG